MIQWGIIGCGDVTEVKSGPAFNKVDGSSLVAVMRRDATKAKDYATRHKVSKWYSDAYQLINDPDVNAIYVATPPDSHEEYTIASLRAGKPVYVEKPMSLNAESANRMMQVSVENNVKLCIAHYRRAQPAFRKIKELIDAGEIGKIKFVHLTFLKAALSSTDLQVPKTAWRVNPAIAGGGLFHDLAPHQLDLMLFLFGNISGANGFSYNQEKKYDTDDIVTGSLLFENGILFNGLWCFTVTETDSQDKVEITGSKGKIAFNVFEEVNVQVEKNNDMNVLIFEKIEHVQQPMIEKVVQYFSGKGHNPCPPEVGVTVMKIMDSFVSKSF